MNYKDDKYVKNSLFVFKISLQEPTNSSQFLTRLFWNKSLSNPFYKYCFEYIHLNSLHIDPVEFLRYYKMFNDFSLLQCDKDQDGFVSLEELTAFIKSNEQTTPTSGPLTPIIINNYQRFDQNHDNKLDFEEFVAMITNDSFLRDFANLGNRWGYI